MYENAMRYTMSKETDIARGRSLEDDLMGEEGTAISKLAQSFYTVAGEALVAMIEETPAEEVKTAVLELLRDLSQAKEPE